MSSQSNNFKSLVKGNPVSQVIRALKMASPSVRNELMQEYSVNSIEALAVKLS